MEDGTQRPPHSHAKVLTLSKTNTTQSLSLVSSYHASAALILRVPDSHHSHLHDKLYTLIATFSTCRSPAALKFKPTIATEFRYLPLPTGR